MLLWWLAVGWVDATGLTGIGWLDTTISYAGDFAVVIISAWLLFVPITSAVMGLVIDEVAEVVERRSYPGLPPAKGAGFWASLWSGVRFGVFALLLNLLVLPLYFVPVVNLVLFVGLNGVLLSREYFETGGAAPSRHRRGEGHAAPPPNHALRAWRPRFPSCSRSPS